MMTDPTTGEKEQELERQAADFLDAVRAATRGGATKVDLLYGGVRLKLTLPPLGEGDRGIVFRLRGHTLPLPEAGVPLVLKVAKEAAVCRERLLEESMTTDFFLGEGVVVPRILHMDPLGRYCIKEFIDGESVTSLYLRFSRLSPYAQRVILQGLEQFLTRLLRLFERRPDCKVSISPNNIYVLREGDHFHDPPRFVLIDPGTTLKKSYEGFTFQTYWNEVLPERIAKYQRTGYLQWLLPQEVTETERREAREFEVFRGLTPAEVLVLLKIARTVEFEPEEVVLREGEIGECFYLVLEGEVEARRGRPGSPGYWHVRIGKGAVLGEMAFLLKVPRSMTIVAATPCKLIRIDHDAFEQLLEAKLTAPYKLIHNIAVTLAERLHALDSSHERLLQTAAAGRGTA
ncbi:MAG: cyclic nucleotide-binding domain-containing protein [Acidobacteriota bacterium]|mgnify:CR=1 FL=1|jgi:CRP-like cAMP-binding protein